MGGPEGGLGGALSALAIRASSTLDSVTPQTTEDFPGRALGCQEEGRSREN